MVRCVMAALVLVAGAFAASAQQDFSGSYALGGDGDEVTLTLTEDDAGRLSGALVGGGESYEIDGTVEGDGIVGVLRGAGVVLGFDGGRDGDSLYLEVFAYDASGQPDFDSAELLVFERRGKAVAPRRSVVFNGVELKSEKIGALEQLYRVRIEDGHYWYDRLSGAWGVEGGPTAGFILPELDLGGPLKADASSGDTQVFVNGRELHRWDVMALQQLVGPVAPGRYTLDPLGNIWQERGPWLLNLVQLAQQAASAGGGQGSTIYRSNITGIGTGSSGGTSYVIGEGWSVIVGD